MLATVLFSLSFTQAVPPVQATEPPQIVVPFISPVIPPQAALDKAVAEVQRGDYASVEEVAELAGPKAIPLLAKLFAESDDPQTKSAVALKLILRSVPSDEYFQYLLRRANEAIDSAIPDPLLFDIQGEPNMKDMSPAFLAYVEANHLDTSRTAEKVLYELPGTLLQLAMTTDPRAIPVLRKALTTTKSQFQGAAASGLAGMRDLASVPFIVRACLEARPAAANTIALFGLLPFDDPQATRQAQACLAPEVRRGTQDFVPGPPFPKPTPPSNLTHSE